MTGRSEDPPPAFEPRPLAGRELDVQVTSGMRMLRPADREAALARARADASRGRWDHPRRRRRLASFVLGALVFLPLLASLLLPAGARTLGAQVLAAALVGLVLGARRWGRTASGAWVGAYIPLLLALQGVPGRVASFAGLMWTFLFFLLGFAMGTSDQLARDEDP